MTEKTALKIAYNILNDELDALDNDYGYEATDDSYYKEIQEAIKVIKGMIKVRAI